MTHLPYAIFNGCDAVYLGGKRFGARAYASNFTDEEMIEAIQYCHLYDVKIYVTINTMIYERERKAALDYVGFLFSHHVDAVIVSDIGLIFDIHKSYPKLDIHLSTQAHTSTVSSIKFYKDLGITRVVLDRELSLSEINSLPPILEYEVFIHGALCVSYSGQCLMSALNEGRSGNRGTCAQYCRMKYKVLKDGVNVQTFGDYILSTKELNTSSHMKELMNSNITSFKIEGRMKSPQYVGFITKFYRNLMNNNDISLNDEKNLRSLFTREFTDGYLFSRDNIMNFKSPNHQGISLGDVLDVNKKKIKIKLNDELFQEDGVKFLPSDKGMIVNFLYDKSGKLIRSARKGDIVYLDNKVNLSSLEEVRKTLDKRLMDSIDNFMEKKIPISMDIRISLPTFSLLISDGKNEVFLSKDIVENAKTCSVTKDDVINQMNRLGNTPFILQTINVSMDGHFFIPVRNINEIRREGIDILVLKRKEIYEN